MKISLFKINELNKDELQNIKGAEHISPVICGCICVGPVTPSTGGISIDGDCADCGASNAHRATNTH